MPNIQSGLTGLGWHLNTGGTITREIRGYRDDEVFDIPGSVKIKGYYHFLKSGEACDIVYEHILSSRSARYWQKSKTTPATYYDISPDLFSFNFMGFSGDFTFTPSGEVVICNTNSQQGEFKISLELDGNKFHSFKIITDDGYKYTFGGSPNNMDYSVPEDAYDDMDIENQADLHFIPRTNTSTVIAWHLSRIEAPNGDVVSFKYYENKRNNVLSYNIIYENYQNYSTDPFDGGLKEQRRYTNAAVMEHILIEGKAKIKMDYSEKSFERDMNGSVLGRLKLDNIKIYSISSSFEKLYRSCQLSYDYSQRGNPKLFLTGLHIPGEGSYEMDYYHRSDREFPKLDTWSLDHWKYFNGKNVNRDNFIPEMESGHSHGGQYYQEEVLSPNNAREHDERFSVYGMLQFVKYPTGGTTSFSYQPHTYSMDVKNRPYFPLDYRDYMPEISTSPFVKKYAGGVRVSGVLDDDGNGGIANSTTYIYDDGNISNGILLFQPRYIYYFMYPHPHPHYNGTLVCSWFKDSEMSCYSRNRVHIEYSSVTERRSDNSSVEHNFTNYSTHPDQISYSTYGDWFQPYEANHAYSALNLVSPTNSMHFERGRPASTRYFNSENEEVAAEYYNYGNFPYDEYIPTLQSCRFIYKEFKDYTGSSRLMSKEKFTFVNGRIIPETTSYTYNDKGQVKSITTRDSHRNYIIDSLLYVYDVNSAISTQMKNANIVRYPITGITYLEDKDHNSRQIIGYSRYIFQRSSAPLRTFFNLQRVDRLTSKEPLDPNAQNIPLDWSVVYEIHGNSGRIVQINDKNGVSTSYIWCGDYLLAELNNVKLNRITSIAGFGSLPTTGLNVSNHYDSVRNEISLTNDQITSLQSIENAIVTIYRHRPLTGITCVIDCTGKETTYDYDEFGRLQTVSDTKQNLINKYMYNTVSN